ncbi:sterol desaturase family protein [Vibrio sp. WXL103]|uniref:sterol desaturase family protein n=1 Tax=Vibrio sp. WXL103 TaxID=3450710 RepID=UPI003EC5C671
MNADVLRLGCFFSIFIACAVWEQCKPRRVLSQPKWLRWGNNLSLVVLNSVLLKLLLPVLAVDLAYQLSATDIGLLNTLNLPLWLSMLLTVLVLDFAIYWQHRLFHQIPMLWKLHRMHHSDQDIDVTTGARFHPIEIILSMLIKLIVVALLGAPALGVVLFEIILNGSAMFNHSNARMPLKLDRILRGFVVTPDMHRVHHSTIRTECNANYGFFLSIWDRLFASYIPQPSLGHSNMQIGTMNFRTQVEQRIDKMLTQPFRSR